MKGETVRDVGEFGLIERLAGALGQNVTWSPDLFLGIGDDAAVWRPPSTQNLIITTDSLVEEVHFRLDWTDWRSLGHKALAVNLSDIAAMGGVPKIATVTLGLRGTEPVDGLVAMYKGMAALAAKHRTLIVGGDIVASPHCLTIQVTAIGNTRRNRLMTRKWATPGGLIGVSGTLGAAAAGLRLLQEDKRSPRRTAATAKALIDAHLRPEPRVQLGAALVKAEVAAAMDLSDGLLGDLPKILAASNVAARIDAGKLPVAAAVRALFPDDWLTLATRGGEDYELLFTIRPDRWERARFEAELVGATITAIGEILPLMAGAPRLLMVDLDGVEREVQTGAFDHFRER